MILKKLSIRNFRLYYGENSFNFSDRLTLIIGDNGDGKTTFFEALKWLLDTTTSITSHLENNISAKRLSELVPGEEDEVSVAMHFLNDDSGIKVIEKKFRFSKTINGESYLPKVSDYAFNGYVSGSGGQFMPYSRTGKEMVIECFDTTIQKYSMFKGESNLNVLDDNNAINDLINKFSSIGDFEKYEELTKTFVDKAERNMQSELNSDRKTEHKAKELDRKITEVKQKINDARQNLRKQKELLASSSSKLDDLEKSKETSEHLKDLNETIRGKKKIQLDLEAKIDVFYNFKLLDQYWILCAYPSIFKEFSKKMSSIDREKRRLEDDYKITQAKNEAEKEVINKLKFTPLAWDLPDAETMQEMLNEHVCKVCGREAPEGSDAYEFMKAKLEHFIAHIEAENKKKEVLNEKLFKTNHIGILRNMSIRFSGHDQAEVASIFSTIKDHIEFIAERRSDINKVNEEIQELVDEKTRFLIQNGNGLSEDELETRLANILGLMSDKDRYNRNIADAEYLLRDLESELNGYEEERNNLDPSSKMGKIAQAVHVAFEKINYAFVSARKLNLQLFLEDLENRANEYFCLLNKDDFHGVVKIHHHRDTDHYGIRLFSSDKSEILNPGGAQQTTMYMSVLFAISDLTSNKKKEDYPMIFDAPTSAFGAFKEDVFYNVIDKEVEKQCIIVTKDLLEVNANGEVELNMNKVNKLNCSVYRICKDKSSGFDANDISTIHTIVKSIKEVSNGKII